MNLTSNKNNLTPYQIARMSMRNTSASAENKKETADNGMIGWLKDSFDAGVANTLANQTRTLAEYSPFGGDMLFGGAEYLDKIAERNTPVEELTGGNYIASAIGNALGSGVVTSAEMALILAGAGAGGLGATVLGTASKLPVLGGVAKGVQALSKTPMGKAILAKTAGGILDAPAEMGSVIKEMRKREDVTDQQIRDAAAQVGLQNLALQALSGGVEASALGKITNALGNSTRKGKFAIPKSLSYGALTGGATEGVEEGLQNIISTNAQGLPIDWKQVAEDAQMGAIGGAFLGGLGGGIGAYANKRAQQRMQNAIEAEVIPEENEVPKQIETAEAKQLPVGTTETVTQQMDNEQFDRIMQELYGVQPQHPAYNDYAKKQVGEYNKNIRQQQAQQQRRQLSDVQDTANKLMAENEFIQSEQAKAIRQLEQQTGKPVDVEQVMQQPIPQKAVNDKKIADVVEKASQGDNEALKKFNNWSASVRLAMLMKYKNLRQPYGEQSAFSAMVNAQPRSAEQPTLLMPNAQRTFNASDRVKRFIDTKNAFQNAPQTSVVAPQQEQSATPNQVVTEQVKTPVSEDVAPKATSKEELQAKIKAAEAKANTYVSSDMIDAEYYDKLRIKAEGEKELRQLKDEYKNLSADNNYYPSFTLNEKQNGIEIKFGEIPDGAFRDKMKEAGFQWSQRQRKWYSKQTDKAMQFAESIGYKSEKPIEAKAEEPSQKPVEEVVEKVEVKEEPNQETVSSDDVRDTAKQFKEYYLGAVDNNFNRATPRTKERVKNVLSAVIDNWAGLQTKALDKNNPQASKNAQKANAYLDKIHRFFEEEYGSSEVAMDGRVLDMLRGYIKSVKDYYADKSVKDVKATETPKPFNKADFQKEIAEAHSEFINKVKTATTKEEVDTAEEVYGKARRETIQKYRDEYSLSDKQNNDNISYAKLLEVKDDSLLEKAYERIEDNEKNIATTKEGKPKVEANTFKDNPEALLNNDRISKLSTSEMEMINKMFEQGKEKGEVKKEETPKQVSEVEENDNDTETIDNGRTRKQEVLDGQLRRTESESQIGGNRSTADRISSGQSDSRMETSASQNGEGVQETRGSRNGSKNGDSEPRGNLDTTSERRNVRDGREGRSSATSATLEGINETQELVEGTSKVNRNYHIDDPDALLGGTPKERFLRNQKAIMAVKSIIEEERNATEEEKAVMAAYSGWGSFGQELFQGTWARPLPKAGWEKENEWLRETLGKEAWESAQRSIINAHYTDPITVKSMWDMVKRLGFKNGKILEPSMGVGNFFALMPANIMEHSNLTGIELDEITGRMAKELYPDANIQIKGFQDSKTAKGFYDLIIGNVPFDSHAPADKDYDKLNLTLHDYFIIKGLDQLRSGGLFATITSSGTMDKQTVGARKEMAKRAELVAAYRLPTGAFKQYAGTEVVTDILIFKKRQEELTDAEALKQDWINTVELNGVRINEYFNKNRYNILGEAKVVRNQYGNNSLAVVRMSNYQERLENLYKELPAGVYEKSNQTQHIKYISNHTTDQQNALVTNSDGGLYIVEGEFLKPLNDVKKYVVKNAKDTKKREQELKDFIELRQAYCKLLDAEYSDDGQIEAYRKELNKLYDKFVKNYGSIRKSWAVKYLTKIDEPYSFALQALENDKGGKATILKERMVRSVKKAENPTISDAFVIARYESQDVDIPMIAQLAHTTENAVVKELIKQNAIFKTPTGNYETTDKYLSGNVRVKLREAQDALSRGDKDMERNVEALKEVIPETIPYYNIETNLGAGWINKDYYKQFIGELLNIKDLKAIDLRQEGGSWRITIDDRYKYNPLANSLTVDKVPINVMVAHAFNRTKPNLTKADPMNPKNRIKDEQGIAEAQSKIESIIDKFDNWVWNDDERKIALEHDYNEVMNAIATPVYDGSFLQMAGMMLAKGNGQFSLRQHQMNAIYRGIVNKRGIYAHEVGTGKTYTMGGLAIESRRYGIAKKPILFAHNANSAQVAKEIQEMYPAAKILYIDNLEPSTIKRRMYQIQNDDWDLVIVPHSQINKFALKQETLMDLAADDIRALEDAAIDAALTDNEKLSIEEMDELLAEQQNPNKDKSKKGSKIRSATAKRLVSLRNTMLINIQKQANKATSKDTISFENLGVDMIIVDEAHIFKKPGIVTQMSMKGLDTSSSSAAFQLKCLTQFVQSMNGGTGVHLFTGTPITNTLAEMYSMMRYVMPQEMRDANIYDFDRWFNVFAAETNDIEITNTGEYEPVRRLASFTNVAELRRMVGNLFDIVFADDMPEFEPRKTDTGKTLDSKNLTEAERDQLLNGRTENPKGRPYKKIINVEVPLGERQQDVLQTLIKYAKEFKDATPKERREMSQKGDPRAPILIETAANNAGMDVRLYDKNIPAENVSKETICVQNVVEIYKSHPKAVQVIFMERGLSDTSTRVIARDEEGKAIRGTVEVFNLGKDIVNELVKQGIPRDEIVIMSSDIKPADRAKLAEQLSEGKKRVVIGSTATLGTGVNMQGNLRAMHHLDAPWTPAELEQRNGRGQRQGNAWNTVLEFRYLTEKLDGKRWQVLSVKDRFIKMYLKADDSLRTIEGDAVDMNEEEKGVTDLQETLSKATGDARILLREKYTSDIKNLEKKERLFITGIKELNTKIKQTKDILADLKTDLETYKEAATNYDKVKDDDFEIRLAKMRGVGKSQYISFDKFSEAKEHLESLVTSMKRGEQMPIGVFKGFDLILEKSTTSDNAYFIIKQGSFKEYTNGTIEGVRARLNSLDKLIEATKAKINDLEEQIPVMEKNAKAVFPQTDTLTAKRKMLADVIRDLRDNPVPPPAWLVQGAPVDTEVFYENEPYTVTGHKANNDGYYVAIADKEENSAVIPYQEAKDSQGMYLYDVEKYGESIPYRRQNSLFIYDSSDDDIIVRSIKPLGENETKVVEIAERYGGRKEENAFIFDDEGGRDSFFEEATDYLESSKAKSNVGKDKKFSLAESEEYIQSKKEIIDDLVDIFGDDVKHEIQGNNILITTANGKRLLIRIEDEIILNDEEMASGKKDHAITDDTEVDVAGYWQRLTKDDVADGELVLSLRSPKGIAYHEILHAVMDLALTAKEKAALIRSAIKEAKETGKDVEEVIAERYRKWVLARKRGEGTAFGKLFKKMQDFYYKLKKLFTGIENAHNVMRKIESREVWERGSENINANGSKKYLVTNNQITGETLVPVIDVTGLPKIDTTLNSVKAAIAKNLIGKTFRIIGSNGIGRVASVSDGKHFIGSSKSDQRKVAVRQKAMNVIEDVLNNAVYIEKHTDAVHGTNNKYIELYAVVKNNKDLTRFRIVAKEGDNTAGEYEVKDAKFYDIIKDGSITASKFNKLADRQMSNDTQVRLKQNVPSTISVANLLTGVNDRNGKPYVNKLGELKYETGARKYSITPSKNKIKGITVTTSPQTLKQQVKEQGYKGWFKGLWKDFYRNWVDKNDSLHGLDEAMQMALGRPLSEEEKVYNRAQTMNATAAGRAKALIEGDGQHIKSLSEQMGRKLHNVTLKKILEFISKDTMDRLFPNYLKDNDYENWIDAFGHYLTARRLREMVRLYGDEYKLPKGITIQDIEKAIQEAPAPFKKAAQMYYDFNDNLLTILEDAGIISKEVHELLNTKYKEYCPLMRDFSDTAGADTFLNGLTTGGRGIGNVSSTLKRISLEGSERGVINPLESTIKSVAVMMNRAERNKVGQMAVKLAGEKGMENIIREIPTPKGGNAVADPKNSIFTVMFNGKKVAYQCAPELYGAIVGYNVPAAGFVLGVARSTARMLRTGATMSPSFIIRNLIRDTIFASISSQNGFIPIVDTIRGAQALLHNAELKAEFETAGVTAFNFYKDAETAYKSLVELNGGKELSLRNPIDLIKFIGRNFEQFSAFAESATRMGEFKRAREAGKSIEEATRDAKEITIDFSRSGVIGENINLYVPFFNATIQGGDKLYRLFRDNPVGTAVNVAKYIVLPSIALWCMNYDDEEYKELDPKIKMTHWIIGDVRIPKPQEAGILFGSGVEAMLDMATEKDPKAMKLWARQVGDGLFPNAIPTILLPLIEWQANYSFFREGKLVGYREERLPDELQYKDSTSEASKALGKLTGLSPIKLDNTVRGYTGTMGMLLWQAYDFGSMDKAKLPDKKLVELPLIRDFFVNDYNTRRSVDDFYKLAEQADKQHSGYGAKGKPTAVVKGIRQAKQQISNLNKDIRNITASNLSPAEKREHIDRKREIIKRIAQRANERYSKFYD